MKRIQVHQIAASTEIHDIKEAITLAESKGATEMIYESSGDPNWDFRWIRFYAKTDAVECMKSFEFTTEVNASIQYEAGSFYDRKDVLGLPYETVIEHFKI